MKKTKPLLAVLTLAISGPVAAADEPKYDMVIYGGTSGAVTAAVQASKMGKSAIILNPYTHLDIPIGAGVR